MDAINETKISSIKRDLGLEVYVFKTSIQEED